MPPVVSNPGFIRRRSRSHCATHQERLSCQARRSCLGRQRCDRSRVHTTPDLLFAEVAEDFRAYSVENQHRHLLGLRAVIAESRFADNDLLFVPPPVTVARGILATITVPVTDELSDPLEIWREAYANEPFIEIANEARHFATWFGDTWFASAAQSRKDFGNHAHCHRGDRQSRERRSWPGGSEREPHARSGRNDGPAGMNTVIKIGGRAQASPQLVDRITAAWSAHPGSFCIVHGGGDEISAFQRRVGLNPSFVNGRRITTSEDMMVVRMVLSGLVNKRLVSHLVAAGAPQSHLRIG